MRIPQFDLFPACARLDLFGERAVERKITEQQLYVNKHIFKKIVQGGTRFASPRNVFPRLDSVSIHLSGYTTSARSVLPFITARIASWRLLTIFFCTQCTELPFFLQFK